ncbi:hypothetical protein GC197_04760 [bacterium]|nr:hypothetical protein [bacterium]
MVRMVCTLIAISSIAFSPALLHADSPVQFDVGFLVAAHDVTTHECRQSRPGYRLVQMDIMISTLVDSDLDDDLLETNFFIEPHNPRIQIEDFSPQTTLQSPYAGNISKEKRIESNIGTDVTAKETIPPGITGTASLGLGTKHATVEKVDVLPEMKLVTASGTIHRGRGVYFRFHRTAQTSLEGTTVLGVVLLVPENWSADTMTVRCQSKIRKTIVPGVSAQEVDLPEARFTLAMYQSDDLHASQVADRYIQAESRWQSVQRQYADQINQRRHHSPLDYLTSIVRHDRSEMSVAERMKQSPEKAARELPPAVVDAYYRFQEAKSLIDRCSGLRSSAEAKVTDEATVANTSVTIQQFDD